MMELATIEAMITRYEQLTKKAHEPYFDLTQEYVEYILLCGKFEDMGYHLTADEKQWIPNT